MLQNREMWNDAKDAVNAYLRSKGLAEVTYLTQEVLDLLRNDGANTLPSDYVHTIDLPSRIIGKSGELSASSLKIGDEIMLMYDGQVSIYAKVYMVDGVLKLGIPSYVSGPSNNYAPLSPVHYKEVYTKEVYDSLQEGTPLMVVLRTALDLVGFIPQIGTAADVILLSISSVTFENSPSLITGLDVFFDSLTFIGDALGNFFKSILKGVYNATALIFDTVLGKLIGDFILKGTHTLPDVIKYIQNAVEYPIKYITEKLDSLAKNLDGTWLSGLGSAMTTVLDKMQAVAQSLTTYVSTIVENITSKITKLFDGTAAVDYYLSKAIKNGELNDEALANLIQRVKNNDLSPQQLEYMQGKLLEQSSSGLDDLAKAVDDVIKGTSNLVDDTLAKLYDEVPLGKGQTGRYIPETIQEQMFMKSVLEAPLEGATKLPMDLGDPRWLGSDG